MVMMRREDEKRDNRVLRIVLSSVRSFILFSLFCDPAQMSQACPMWLKKEGEVSFGMFMRNKINTSLYDFCERKSVARASCGAVWGSVFLSMFVILCSDLSLLIYCLSC